MGTSDIFVAAMPKEAGGTGAGTMLQISRAGGIQPVWRGKEILYVGPDGRMVSVPVEGTDSVRTGDPVELFDSGSTGTAWIVRGNTM